MADIEGMFMQVGVRAQDCGYLRFLSTKNEFEEPEVYEYQRHILERKTNQLAQFMHYNKLPGTTRLNFQQHLKQYSTTFTWMTS